MLLVFCSEEQLPIAERMIRKRGGGSTPKEAIVPALVVGMTRLRGGRALAVLVEGPPDQLDVQVLYRCGGE